MLNKFLQANEHAGVKSEAAVIVVLPLALLVKLTD
jgi:hypothetical protein